MIMKKADDYLPLASSYGGKLFHVVRSSFVDSLEACLKSYYSRSMQVNNSDLSEDYICTCIYWALGTTECYFQSVADIKGYIFTFIINFKEKHLKNCWPTNDVIKKATKHASHNIVDLI